MSIKMIRREDGFAEFTNGKYAVAIDGAYNVREKIGVVVEAFQVKGGSKASAEELAIQIGAAIAEVGE